MKYIKATLLLATFALSSSLMAGTTVVVHGYWPFKGKGKQIAEDCHNKSTCDIARPGFDKVKTVSGYSTIRHVGWEAHRPWLYHGVPKLLEVLNSKCKRTSKWWENRCRVICHSTGCPITDYVLDKYGSRYRINHVVAMASAMGGSEIATLKAGTIDALLGPLMYLFSGAGNYYLIPAVIRNLYNHNDTAGVTVYHQVGYKFTATSAFIPGRDDGTVGFHSASAYSGVVGAKRIYKCQNSKKACVKHKKVGYPSCRIRRWKLRCTTKYKYIPYPSLCTRPKYSGHRLTDYMLRQGSVDAKSGKAHKEMKAETFQVK